MSPYKELLKEFEGYARTADGVEPLMDHIAHRLHERMARYNWVGFYRTDDSLHRTLLLGPFVGSFEPLEKIPFDLGLCGAAAATGKTVLVNKVLADPRYVSRGNMVKSEIVAPILVKKDVAGIVDVESYFVDTFSNEDQDFVESCASIVARYLEGEALFAAKRADALHRRLGT
jgi:L-methionine (R)-S-oxide reductase